ncbi:NAD-dependent epimerase/dehydratase family protein, partial [bacterium]|nr:NAD-dependent epimerase/dehydratase family protein [bacterium]
MAESKGLIVVTGGVGFIGNNLVRKLNDMGCDSILVVDELDRSEKWKNLDGIIMEDYLDKGDFMRHIQEGCSWPINAVFHLGACSSTTETDSAYLMENNYRYTRRLCEWCLERGVRFITASSAATYGDGSLGYSDKDDDTPAYSPLNMYGMSKHLFDLWALSHGVYSRIVG